MSLLFDVVDLLTDSFLSQKLTPNEKFTLTVIAHKIGRNDNTWVKQSTLAKLCNMNERHIRRILNKLYALNLIKKNKVITKKGKQNSYQISTNFEDYRTFGDKKHVVTTGHTEPVPTPTTGHTEPVATGHTEPVLPSKKVIQLNDSKKEISQISLLNGTIELDNKKINKTIKKKPVSDDPVVLPDFVPQESWNEFLQFRKEKDKKPLTRLSQTKALNRLAEHHRNGQDVVAVIDQSILCGWAGLFAVRNNFTQSKVSKFDEYVKRKQEYLDDPTGTKYATPEQIAEARRSIGIRC